MKQVGLVTGVVLDDADGHHDHYEIHDFEDHEDDQQCDHYCGGEHYYDF